MPSKTKKAAAKPKNQKEAILQSAQNAIQERLQKTSQQSPLKPDIPVAVEPAVSDSSDDEDFNPDVQPAEVESSSSEDEAEAAIPGAKKQKGKRKRDDDDVDAELVSGDEGIIQKRISKRHKKGGDDGFLSDDEGGEAGFIKTRAQRRTEQQERRPLTQIGNATADVDSIWARLAGLPIGRPPETLALKPTENEEDYITIHRTTKFAGQVTTEKRQVPKTSQEAKVYIAEQDASKQKQRMEQEAELVELNVENDEGKSNSLAPPPLRRPLFRKSRFEPNPTGEVKALPPHLQLRWPRDKWRSEKVPGTDESMIFNPRALPMLAPAAKLNTVQKSKYDWAGYVDKVGIAEELDQYGKSKQSYAERTTFLNRLEGRREEERLAAKRKVA